MHEQGVLPSWPLLTIAECASDEPYSTQIGPFGKALTPEAYKPSGVPLLRGVNVNSGRFHDDDYVFISEEDADRLAKFESFPGDVLLVHKGTLGPIGLMPENRKYARYIMGNSMLRVRCDRSKLLPDYLRYWLKSTTGQCYLLSRVSQVGVPQLHRPLTTLREATLPVPPVTVQEQIVGVLGALDDKIEQNRRTGRALEGLARAVFKAWFVDFEPVKAKAAGQTSFPAMPPAAFAALPDRFVASELGPVPEGWAVRPLSQVANFLNGLALQKYPPIGDGTDLPVIKIAQLRKGSTDGAGLANADIPGAYIIENGDLLFSWSGTLEVELWFGGQGALNQHLFKVTSDAYPRWLCLHWVRQHLPDFRLIAAGKATTMGHIKRGHLDSALVAVPDDVSLQAADKMIGPLHDLLASLAVESRKLAALRDYLLPRLLSGQVRLTRVQ